MSVLLCPQVTAEDSVKTTTVPPMEAGGNAFKASTDHIDPSSWAFKKSLPPQPKKPNKRGEGERSGVIHVFSNTLFILEKHVI